MLRYLLVLINLLPSFVFAQQLTDSQLATQLLTLIPNNTSNAITPANVRKVTQDGYDARISIYGNLGIKGLLGYNTLFTLTNDKQLVHKKYVDDKFHSISIDTLTFSLPLLRTVNNISLQRGTSLQNGYLAKEDFSLFSLPSDWNATSGPKVILNKPTIPAAQVNTDWNSTSGLSRLLNKPTFGAVAFSNSYLDLTNRPTIPASQVNTDWNSTSGISQLLNKPNLSIYEQSSNKVTNLLSPNNTTFPTTKAVKDAIDTLASHIDFTGSGIELGATEPIYTSGFGSGMCILLGSDGSPLLGSDGSPLTGPCGGFAINVRYADSSTAGVITAAKYAYLSNLDAVYAKLLGSYINPAFIVSLAKSKITGLIDPVNADWNSVSGLSQILNKPSIPAAQVNVDWNASSGIASILNKPTIPAAQVAVDWNSTSGITRILNKPTFGAVAFSNSYIDLANKPSIPSAQINSDWNVSSGLAQILNKPTIPAAQINSDWNSVSGLSQILNKPSFGVVAFSNSYLDLINKPTIPAAQVNSDWSASSGITSILNKPTIPAAQVNSDWTATSGITRILNKPSLVAVATTGDYNDLINKPTITPGQVNADWNATSGISQILNKPTNLSAFANGPGYITGSSTSLLTNKSGNISQWTNNVGYLTATTISGLYIPLTGTISGHDVTGPINWQDGVNGGTGMSIGEKFSSGESMITFYDPSLLEIHGKIFMSSLIGSDIDTPWSLEIQNFDRFNFGEGQFVYSGDNGLAIRSTALSGGTSYNRSRINFESLDLSQHISLGLQDSIVDQYDVSFPRNQPTNNSAWGYKDGKYKWLPMASGGGGGTITAVSIASANGFSGASSGGATPALTIRTTATGILKGNGTAISAATAGTDYQAPITLTTTGSGAATFSGGVLNIPTPSGAGSSPPFSDINPLVKNFTDATKQLIINTSLIGTGQIRVLSAQNASYTMAGIDITNIFTKYQKFTSAAFSTVPFPGDFGYDGTHWYGATPAGNLQLDNQLSLLTTTMINSLYGYTPANPSSPINWATPGTSGTAPNWSTSSTALGGTATLNIPTAGPTVTSGTFTNGTQSLKGDKTLDGSLTFASGSGLGYSNPQILITGAGGAGTGRIEKLYFELTTTTSSNIDQTVINQTINNSASLAKIRVVARRTDTGGVLVKEANMVVKNFGTVSLAPTYTTIFQDSDMSTVTITNNGNFLRISGISGVTINYTIEVELMMSK